MQHSGQVDIFCNNAFQAVLDTLKNELLCIGHPVNVVGLPLKHDPGLFLAAGVAGVANGMIDGLRKEKGRIRTCRKYAY
jgi:hypothetical protein